MPSDRHDHGGGVEREEHLLAVRRSDQHEQQTAADEQAVEDAGAYAAEAQREEHDGHPSPVAEVAPQVAEDPVRLEVQRDTDVRDRVLVHEAECEEGASVGVVPHGGEDARAQRPQRRGRERRTPEEYAGGQHQGRHQEVGGELTEPGHPERGHRDQRDRKEADRDEGQSGGSLLAHGEPGERLQEQASQPMAGGRACRIGGTCPLGEVDRHGVLRSSTMVCR